MVAWNFNAHKITFSAFRLWALDLRRWRPIATPGEVLRQSSQPPRGLRAAYRAPALRGSFFDWALVIPESRFPLRPLGLMQRGIRPAENSERIPSPTRTSRDLQLAGVSIRLTLASLVPVLFLRTKVAPRKDLTFHVTYLTVRRRLGEILQSIISIRNELPWGRPRRK